MGAARPTLVAAVQCCAELCGAARFDGRESPSAHVLSAATTVPCPEGDHWAALGAGRFDGKAAAESLPCPKTLPAY
jgi:hypothetical protein